MDKRDICEELSKLSDDCLNVIINVLPVEQPAMTALFAEMVRVTDVLAVTADSASKDDPKVIQYLNIVRLGWNLAASLLYTRMEQLGFPMADSNRDTQKSALSLLYQMGHIALLRRGIDMVYADILTVKNQENKFIFKNTGIADFQYSDIMEFHSLDDLSQKINKHENDFFGDWKLVEYDKIKDIMFNEGNFLSRARKKLSSDFTKESLQKEIGKLVRTWDSGHGEMIAYDSTPEIDFHYLYIALELVIEWRSEAGLHPTTKLQGITGAELTMIVAVVVALHLKHTEFTLHGSKRFPKMSLHQSISIWGIKSQLTESIHQFTGQKKEVIELALDAITLKSEDNNFIKNPGLLLKPLLIDLGNGYILRPISGLTSNPFFTIIALSEHRNPQTQHEILKPREQWQRMLLYAQFAGSRYLTLSIPIKIRKEGRVLTDIDAAILDILSGELAIFQLKWQNYFFNDVKRLRSRASNLTEETDQWAKTVLGWISTNGLAELAKTMQLKSNPIKKVYLFGISYSTARTKGYGYTTKEQDLALANWPQFIRIRTQTGPAENIFSKIHSVIKAESELKVSVQAVPLEFTLDIYDFVFEDLYSIVT